jgi:hypothetical protein
MVAIKNGEGNLTICHFWRSHLQLPEAITANKLGGSFDCIIAFCRQCCLRAKQRTPIAAFCGAHFLAPLSAASFSFYWSFRGIAPLV